MTWDLPLAETCICTRCGGRGTPDHACPYEQDINGNEDDAWCTCCEECRRMCVDDV